VHDSPAKPHAKLSKTWHKPLAQQPVGHEVASHVHCPPPVVPTHSRPEPAVAQLMQMAPAAPHCVFTVPPAQLPPTPAVQQPLGQELALQVHCPATQCWSLLHIALAV
jgi:hypothetical protein